MTYAADTSVSVERSRAEVERTLQRYGATSFAYGWDGDAAMIEFVADQRRVRFIMPLPDRDSREFTLTPTGKARKESQAFAAWEQACRARWRALNLVIKAKLEAVEVGISEFEQEFLAYVVLPNGCTVGQMVRPQVEEAYLSGKVAPMLAIGTGS